MGSTRSIPWISAPTKSMLLATAALLGGLVWLRPSPNRQPGLFMFDPVRKGYKQRA